MLNTLLLFIILFLCLSLKVLAKLLVGIYGAMLSRLFGFGKSVQSSFEGVINPADVHVLMVIYGLGAAGVFLTLTFMYRYALKKAADLELHAVEIFDTKVSIYSNLLLGTVPLLSVVFALVIPHPAVCFGCFWFCLFPILACHVVLWKRMGKKREQLFQKPEII